MNRRRAVITGMGAITPLGNSVESMFAAVVAGRHGVGHITRFDASRFPTSIAAEVKGFCLDDHLPEADRWRPCTLPTHFVLAAARQALEQAGLLKDRKTPPERMGVYLGTGEGVQDFHSLMTIVANSYREESKGLFPPAFIEHGMTGYSPSLEHELELHTASAHVGACFGLEGPNYNCLTSCAAGNQAVGEAVEFIRRGEADVMVAGGTHSIIQPLSLTGFCRLTATTSKNDEPGRASRPFDLRRDGFVPGEGAGVLILEEWEHARRRGAPVLAEISGYGVTADAFRVTDSHPEGRNAVICMRETLADAGLTPQDIGYINAHGTSTQLNDRVETLAIKKIFGAQAHRVPVSSTKSMMGHLIGAAGAVELIICVEAIRRGVLPPTINYEVPDPNCDLDYIPNQAREKKVTHALNNSFGFGGQNVSVIVSRV